MPSATAASLTELNTSSWSDTTDFAIENFRTVFEDIYCGGLRNVGDKLIIAKGSYSEKQWFDLAAEDRSKFRAEIDRQKMTIKCEVAEKLF